MKAFLRIFTLTSVLIWLSSCSSEWHLRRAIAKDPTILQPKEVLLIDTVVVSQGIRVDTLAYFSTDTLTIEKERLRVQIKRIHDTIMVSAECAPDTIRIVDAIELPPQIKYEPRPFWQKVVGWVLLAFVLLALARRVFDRAANNR